MSPSLLGALRSRDARLLWPALLVLFALAMLSASSARAFALAPAAERCLAAAGDDTEAGLGHGQVAAGCVLACAAAAGAGAAPPLPELGSIEMARLGPAEGVPPPRSGPALPTGVFLVLEGPRGPPAA